MKKLFGIIFSFQLMIAPIASAVVEDKYHVTGDGSSEGLSRYMDTIMNAGYGIIGAGLGLAKNEAGVVTPAASETEKLPNPIETAPGSTEVKPTGDFVVGAASVVGIDEYEVNRQDISPKSEVSTLNK